MGAKVLIVDDNADDIAVASRILAREGYSVSSVNSGPAALDALDGELSDVVLSDVDMPRMDGLELLDSIRKRWSRQRVVMMSGLDAVDMAVQAVRHGAVDFVPKPLEIERLRRAVSSALAHPGPESGGGTVLVRKSEGLIGETQSMATLKHLIDQVAPTGCRVLIQGENGTGKELIANALHRQSARRDRPFIKVNCGALTQSLLESELFGHEKGAFTGAQNRRRGRFELADQGTLLLDEVGELSLDAQVRLLRVIQEGEFERVGGTQTIRCDVRIFAASNRELSSMVSAGKFREDLYYRLNVVTLLAPPLRGRRGDIPLLIEDMLSRTDPHRRPTIPQETMQLLAERSYPGNVRELQNTIERLVVLLPGEEITPQKLNEFAPAEEVPPLGLAADHHLSVYQPGVNYRERLLQLERKMILEALDEHGGSKSAAAQSLGTDKSFFYRKCRQFGVD